MTPKPLVIILFLAAAFLPRAVPSSAAPAARDARPVVSSVTDSLYDANHPRLLFGTDGVQALRDRTRAGGRADAAYDFILDTYTNEYRQATLDELLDNDFGLEAIANLALVGYLEPDVDALELGRTLTLYIAYNWDVSSDPYYSALRLRALSLGYDLFFQHATSADRAYVVSEILSYIDFMTSHISITAWWYRPYLSNKSAMVAASLGLAAVCLSEEIDSAIVSSTLEDADDLVATWLAHHVDAEGAGVEGVLYASWSLRNLVYYFHARLAFDGTDYALNSKVRNMERWFAYELDPVAGDGKVNNIHDCTGYDYPLARHTTYFDWAQAMWGSRLSAYLWEHVAGEFGTDFGDFSDKAGTVLWSQDLEPQQPEEMLTPSFLWGERGLYYYRSGWPAGGASDDVVFSFYSGPFQGGHAQEDQNQFTLMGYGEAFVIDHGVDAGKESEAHNIVFIDGAGQHNAGASIGTDGRIVESLLGGSADYILGDATAAYTTHSPFNDPDVPFPGTDWSWGYRGANPVERAFRRVVVVRDPVNPPYFVIFDEVKKDDDPHLYQWRIHTADDNTIDTSANPLMITGDSGYLFAFVMNPHFQNLTIDTTHFDNGTDDPDANVLSFSLDAVEARFSVMLFPGEAAMAPPQIVSRQAEHATVTGVSWSSGITDVWVVNHGGRRFSTTLDPFELGIVSTDARTARPARAASGLPLTTDGSILFMRFSAGTLDKYLAVNASTLDLDGKAYVSIANGTVNVEMSNGRINIDRPDADFVFYGPSVNGIFYRSHPIDAVMQDGYLYRDPSTGVDDVPRADGMLSVRAYPNPFNPVTEILLSMPAPQRVTAAIYDPLGRRVRRLLSGELRAGTSVLSWDGTNDRGRAVPSGVYLLKVVSERDAVSLKLTVLK